MSHAFGETACAVPVPLNPYLQQFDVPVASELPDPHHSRPMPDVSPVAGELKEACHAPGSVSKMKDTKIPLKLGKI